MCSSGAPSWSRAATRSSWPGAGSTPRCGGSRGGRGSPAGSARSLGRRRARGPGLGLAALDLVEEVRAERLAPLGLQGPVARDHVAELEDAHRIEEPDAVAHVEIGREVAARHERRLLQVTLRLDPRLIEPDALAQGLRQQVPAAQSE